MNRATSVLLVTYISCFKRQWMSQFCLVAYNMFILAWWMAGWLMTNSKHSTLSMLNAFERWCALVEATFSLCIHWNTLLLEPFECAINANHSLDSILFSITESVCRLALPLKAKPVNILLFFIIFHLNFVYYYIQFSYYYINSSSSSNIMTWS